MMARDIEFEQVSQALADLRYTVSHQDTLADDAVSALRLCRAQIVPDHCAACRAAASLADVVLAQWEQALTGSAG